MTSGKPSSSISNIAPGSTFKLRITGLGSYSEGETYTGTLGMEYTAGTTTDIKIGTCTGRFA